MIKKKKTKEVDKKVKKKSGMTTREKMEARKAKILAGSGGGNMLYLKDGVQRFRFKSPGEDEEIAVEVVQFFLGKGKTSIMSAETFGEPCPWMEKFQELKNSDDEDDLELAKKITPKRKFVIAVVGYKDLKGKEIDPEKVDKLIPVAKSTYQDIIEYYLDEDEWGDMTDPINGYDIKITKSGSGRDTTYTVSPCSKTKLPKEYRGEVDIESIIRSMIKPYDEAEKELNQFLNGADDDDDDDDRPVKKKKKSSDKSKSKDKLKKKKKYKADLDDDDDDMPF